MSVSATQVPTGVYAGYGGGKWHVPASLFLEESPYEFYPSRAHSEMPQFFKLLLLHCISVGFLSCFVFKGGDIGFSHHLGSPKAKPADF